MNPTVTQAATPAPRPEKRQTRGWFFMVRLLVLVLLVAALGSGCSKQMPCPKMPKMKKDSSFKPAAEGDGDDTNNPNDNQANMVLGGGGLKRGKDGLVKKKKFRNLVSPKAANRNYTKIEKPGGKDKTNRNYTKIDKPGGKDKTNRNYTKIDNPGDNKKRKNKYTDIDKPGSAKPGKPEKYTQIDAPEGTVKRKRAR